MHSDDYLEPYRQSVRDNGADSFDATLWASPRTQIKRFEIFESMLPMETLRVLDAGCSRGDMADYLLNSGGFASYVGIDGVPEVIEHARTRALPGCLFVCGDFVAHPELLATGDPEVICISGSLNTMQPAMAMAVLDSAWKAAGKALLFNFLSDKCGPAAPAQTGPARRLDTMAILRWAFSRTPAVAFRQDYFRSGHDATVLMRRSEI